MDHCYSSRPRLGQSIDLSGLFAVISWATTSHFHTIPASELDATMMDICFRTKLQWVTLQIFNHFLLLKPLCIQLVKWSLMKWSLEAKIVCTNFVLPSGQFEEIVCHSGRKEAKSFRSPGFFNNHRSLLVSFTVEYPLNPSAYLIFTWHSYWSH